MSSELINQSRVNTASLDQVYDGLRVVQQLDENAWRRFVEQHPQGNIFHTPEMFHVFSRAEDFHPKQWAVIRDDGHVEALLLPVQVTLYNFLSALTTRAISYGSVLFSPSNEGHRALTLLLKAYVQKNRRTCLFTELRNISDLDKEQSLLEKQGFTYEGHLNYLINLNLPTEEVFQGIGARTRKNIKRGLNKGEVTIREATEPAEIDACYNLLSQTYQAARVPLADRSLFKAAFDVLHPKNMILFTLAYVGNIPVATSVDLLYKNVMYGWYGGMDRAYGKYVPNELLMWYILKWGAENGFHVYDFGGAGKPDEEYGVRDFKAKFGGTLVCYGRNTYVHLPKALWLSTQGYNLMRRLFNGHFLK